MDSSFDINNIQSTLENVYYNNLIKAVEKSSLYNEADIKKKVEILESKLDNKKEEKINKVSQTSSEKKPVVLIQKNISSQSLSEMSPSYNDDYLYQKPWTKLTQIHKIIKIKEFVNSKLLIEDEKEKHMLRDKLVEMVKMKELTKKESIMYDSVKGMVISIPCLEYKNGKYYIK